jgi:hypothetical protein
MQVQDEDKPKSKSKSQKGKKIDWNELSKYYPPKHKAPDGTEIPWAEDDPATMAWLIQYATNAKREAEEKGSGLKEQQEEFRKVQEFHKRQKLEEEQRLERQRTLPQRQYEMLMSGKQRLECVYCHRPLRSIEPGIKRMREEINRLKGIIAHAEESTEVKIKTEQKAKAAEGAAVIS